MDLLNRVMISGLAALSVGCASAIHKVDEAANVRTISVDAKQRFLIQAKLSDGTTVVCPEASPDAMVALGASVGLSAEAVGKAVLSASGSSAESAASIGLRTQSIQLLRDQLVHLCLLKIANPKTEGREMVELFRRYQAATVGILAIEQLTGAIRAPAIVISASGNASAGNPKGDSASKGTQQADAPDKADGTVDPKSAKTTSTSGGAVTNVTIEQKDRRGEAEVVADTVLKIVQHITTVAFDSALCASFYSQAALVEDPDRSNMPPVCASPIISALNACSPAATEGRPEDCIREKVALPAQLASASAGQLVRIAEAAGALNTRSIENQVKVQKQGQPLKAFDIGIFQCQKDTTSAADLVKLEESLRKATDGVVLMRGKFSDLELDRRGFRSATGAVVLFDADEETAGGELAKTVKEAVGVDLKLESNPVDQRPTPLYISLRLCK
jgi:CheY-like chemotaxis protein